MHEKHVYKYNYNNFPTELRMHHSGTDRQAFTHSSPNIRHTYSYLYIDTQIHINIPVLRCKNMYLYIQAHTPSPVHTNAERPAYYYKKICSRQQKDIAPARNINTVS